MPSAEVIENRKRWLAALESGKFRQAERQLVVYDEKAKRKKYCCLGVWWKLCDFAEDMAEGDTPYTLSPKGRKTLGMTDRQLSFATEMNDQELDHEERLKLAKKINILPTEIEDYDKNITFKHIAAYFRSIWKLPKG